MQETHFPTSNALCPHCRGTGHLIDHAALGATLQKRREKAGISRAGMAHALRISYDYLYGLETGRRFWSDERIAAFTAACERVEKSR